jgi:hypothetical protein
MVLNIQNGERMVLNLQNGERVVLNFQNVKETYVKISAIWGRAFKKFRQLFHRSQKSQRISLRMDAKFLTCWGAHLSRGSPHVDGMIRNVSGDFIAVATNITVS